MGRRKKILYISTIIFLPQTFAAGDSETVHKAGRTCAVTPCQGQGPEEDVQELWEFPVE